MKKLSFYFHMGAKRFNQLFHLHLEKFAHNTTQVVGTIGDTPKADTNSNWEQAVTLGSTRLAPHVKIC